MFHEFVLGVDVSTQSVTVEMRAADDFSLVGTYSSRLPEANPPASEQNPTDWWDGLVEAMHGLRRLGLDTTAISAIAIGGQCHGLVPLDHRHEVIRPAQLWNNTLSAPDIEILVSKLGREYWAQECGSVPVPAFTVSKLAWLFNHEASTVEKLNTILLPHDYMNFRLTGQFVTDRSEASGTGYYNSITNRYSFDLLKACFGDSKKWETMFPEVRLPEDTAGSVQDAAASELGVTEGIPVAVGGGDQHLAAAGIGLRETDTCFSLGTSGVVFTMSDTPVVDTTGMIDGVAAATGGWQPLVCTQNSMQVTDLFARILGIRVEDLGQLALSADPSRPRPVLAPYFGGERSPNLPHSSATLSGMTLTLDRPMLALTAVESVLLGLVRGLREIVGHGIRADGRVVAIGGGSRSRAFVQILADLLGRPVSVIDSPEATARGAGLMALAVLRDQKFSETVNEFAPSLGSMTEPREIDQWSHLYSRYLQACEFSESYGRDE